MTVKRAGSRSARPFLHPKSSARQRVWSICIPEDLQNCIFCDDLIRIRLRIKALLRKLKLVILTKLDNFHERLSMNHVVRCWSVGLTWESRRPSRRSLGGSVPTGEWCWWSQRTRPDSSNKNYAKIVHIRYIGYLYRWLTFVLAR